MSSPAPTTSGNPADIVGGFVDQSANARNIGINAVLFQLGIMTAISVVTLLVFEALRPNHKRIYQPKVKYFVGNKRPPPLASGLLSWLRPLIHTKEPQLMDQVGLDAVAFLRFLRMLRWMFLAIGLVVCAVLLPINIVYNIKNNKGFTDPLTEMTIQSLSGSILYIHIGVSYIIVGIVMVFVYYNWRAMVTLRNTWFHSPEYVQSFYARTLMVTNIPPKLQSDEGLTSLFRSLNIPYPTTSVHIGRRVGKLPELIEYHNDTVRELESVLVRYLKDGRIGKRRPTITQKAFLGFGGQKVDAIDFYTEKVRRVEQSIEQWRETIDMRRAEPYGFASMAAVPYAHIVAAQTRRKKRHGAVIQLAPNPKDIIWPNLNASAGDLSKRRFLGWTYLVLFCAFNTVPLFAISILANLQGIAVYVQFLADWGKNSPNTFSLVSGVLPASVMGLFAVLFPVVLKKIGKYQGANTLSRLDRVTVQRYFAFLVISQLVIFTLIGVIFNSIKNIVSEIGTHKSFQDIIDNLSSLPKTINSTYIKQSSYWLTWFPLRGFLMVFDLAQILNVVWVTIKTHLFGRTPRDIREWTQPPEFEYAVYYSNFLFMAVVALVFAPLAPIVPAIAAIMFFISATVYKYQLMFVYTTKVESGGVLWNTVINRLLFSVVFMQLLFVLTIILQLGLHNWAWTASVPPIVAVFIFKYVISQKFSKAFKYYTPSQAELQSVKPHSERADHKGNRLEKRFGHPALHQELFTPMVHAKMTHLLADVYRGRLGTAETDLKEYGGQKVEAKIAPGGLKIAGIDSNDLEYDPALYQRDRGELDWDRQSITSTAYLNDGASIYNGMQPPPSSQQGLMGYDDYLSHGPRGAHSGGSTDNFEMTRIQTYSREGDNTPLLGLQRQESEWSVGAGGGSPIVTPGGTQYPPQQYQQPTQQYQQPPQQYQQPPQQYRQSPQPYHQPQLQVQTHYRSPSTPSPQRNHTPSPNQYPPQYPTQTYDYGQGTGQREAPVQRFADGGANNGFTGVGSGFRR